MGSRIECFVLERTDLARVWLRRYASGACPTEPGYHDARVLIEDAAPFDSEFEGDSDDSHPHDDPRWPQKCDRCGVDFATIEAQPTAAPVWQLFRSRLYRAPDGILAPAEDHRPGALMRMPWYEKSLRWKGADGQCWACRLPDGTLWVIDGPVRGSDKIPAWQRAGTAPQFTVTPSILTPRYHGFLTAGFLVEC